MAISSSKFQRGTACFSFIYNCRTRSNNAHFDRASPEFAARRAEAQGAQSVLPVAQLAPSY
jgi:hypothetical protein